MIPSEISTSKTFFLVSAILNILFALGMGTYSIGLGIFSCGIGCLFLVIPVINIISCVMDFIAYNKLNTLNRPGTFSSIQFAAIMEIVTILTGNFISMIFGIITLVNLNNNNIQSYLRERGIY
jgi:hypothetical protein